MKAKDEARAKKPAKKEPEELSEQEMEQVTGGALGLTGTASARSADIRLARVSKDKDKPRVKK